MTESVDAAHLRAFIERVEKMEEEKKEIQTDIKDIYAEAKGVGYDTKIIKLIVRMRKQDKADRDQQEAILDLYLRAIGEN